MDKDAQLLIILKKIVCCHEIDGKFWNIINDWNSIDITDQVNDLLNNAVIEINEWKKGGS